jgi:hypothetical protein
LQEWLRHRGLSAGAVLSPQAVYDLGVEWYARRLDRDWERADTARVASTFARHGLVGPFWSLD